MVRAGLLLATLAALAVAAVAAANPDPAALVQGAEEVAQAVQDDPGGAVGDPAGTLQPILGPDGSGVPGGGGGGPTPGEAVGPGFAERVRQAFHDQMVFAGLAALVVAGVGVAGFALVTRYIPPGEALKNPQRSMLYGFIRGNPGVHLKKLSEEFSMKTSSILWHMRKLESAELVRSERANGFRVFYPTEGGMAVKLVSRATTALQNGNARLLFEALGRHPGCHVADLAQQSGIHVGTVRWHLRKLREFGLVEELERGGSLLYFATPLGSRALKAIAPTEAVAAAPA